MAFGSVHAVPFLPGTCSGKSPLCASSSPHSQPPFDRSSTSASRPCTATSLLRHPFHGNCLSFYANAVLRSPYSHVRNNCRVASSRPCVLATSSGLFFRGFRDPSRKSTKLFHKNGISACKECNISNSATQGTARTSSIREYVHQKRNQRASRFQRAAYISPPAAPAESPFQPLLEEEEDVDPTLDFVPVAPRGQENVITMDLVRSLVWEEKGRLFMAVLAIVCGTSCTLSMPIFSGQFFETLIGSRTEPLWKFCAKLSLVYMLEPIFTVIFVTNMVGMWEKVMANLRSLVFRRILIQKVEFFDKHKVGELTSLLSSDLGAVKDIVNENVSRDRGFRACSEVLGTIVILFILSPQLAPVLALLMVSVSGVVAVYKRTTLPVFKAHGVAQSRINDCASETISAVRTVRSFGGERRQMSMFDQQVLAFRKSGNKLGWLKSANESWTRMVVYVSLMALYIMGGAKVKSGELAVGRMVSFIGYTFTLTLAMQGVVNTLADLRGVVAAVDRINSIIRGGAIDESLAVGLERESRGDLESTEACKDTVLNNLGDDNTKPLSLKTVCELAWSGDVVLEDVHFAYPLRPDVQVLRGVNMQLKRGTVTAVVGSSGAGKSTIVQLLARFYEPSEGRITLGEQDVRKFDKSEWARAVSIVNQEPVLFAMSVGENIAYGLPNEVVSEQAIIEAAKAANAHDFVEALPQVVTSFVQSQRLVWDDLVTLEGYNTMVGERGGLLSGGQRQRIAIARALLKNAPILILDEATSSLDSVSERLVQDALDRLMKGRTTLVIAHRLSTVQAAEQIFVCANGQVLENGNHAELLAIGGTYSELVNTQRLSFE